MAKVEDHRTFMFRGILTRCTYYREPFVEPPSPAAFFRDFLIRVHPAIIHWFGTYSAFNTTHGVNLMSSFLRFKVFVSTLASRFRLCSQWIPESACLTKGQVCHSSHRFSHYPVFLFVQIVRAQIFVLWTGNKGRRCQSPFLLSLGFSALRPVI